jgi:hypothetical protein
MAVDGADAATAYSAMNSGSLEKRLAIPAIAVAIGAVLGGLLGMGGKKKTKKAAATQ